MRIRWRLTWYGIGFTALTLVGFVILITLLVEGTAAADQDTLLGTIADEAAADVAGADADALTAGIPELVPDASTSDQPFTTIYDEVGVALFATGTVDGAALDLPAAVIVEALESGFSEADVDSVRSQVRRWVNDDLGVGVVAASQTLRVLDQQLAGLRVFLFLFVIVALIAAAIGAWFMAGRALRPLNTLAETTDEIGATNDLSRRLPEVAQDDEVGALTASFNTMLATIEESRRERDLTIESQKRFIADASHELRSPLTSIRANAGFLIDQPTASPQDRQDATSDIAVEADRMGSLIDGLISLARADAGGGPKGKHHRVDLSGLAVEVQRRARNIDVDITVASDGPVVVMGDDGGLAELLWILVDNSRTHGGSRVVVTTERRGSEASVSVADDGPGVPEADRGLVFERFFRADPARSGPGHGLGLSIATAVVERHDGQIEVLPSALGGAEFRITFPAVD